MSQTRFTPDVDLDGLTPEEAFGILGNDIRLEVVRQLWQAGAAHRYDDGAEAAETMAYSALQAAVGVPDNGKLNYHLSELTPHFVRRTDDGYRLSGAGRQIARTVIAVSGADGLDVTTELAEACPLCGAAVSATAVSGGIVSVEMLSGGMVSVSCVFEPLMCRMMMRSGVEGWVMAVCWMLRSGIRCGANV
jgi:hypothetical protein